MESKKDNTWLTIVVFIIISIWLIILSYVHFNYEYKLSTIQNQMDELKIENEKMQYYFENKQDTIVINLNNYLKTN